MDQAVSFALSIPLSVIPSPTSRDLPLCPATRQWAPGGRGWADPSLPTPVGAQSQGQGPLLSFLRSVAPTPEKQDPF